VKLPQRNRCRAPRAKTIRIAEPYLLRGAEEARRRRHAYVGTEHVLFRLLGDQDGDAARLLRRLRVDARTVERALEGRLGEPPPSVKIDPDALATLGIDLDTVRKRLEETFGAGALERTPSSCLGVTPRLKRALAHAVDVADDDPLDDRHVLLGLLSVPDSVAAGVLSELGVSLADARRLD